MTKEDYMKLSKERLAELLEEKDRELFALPVMPITPSGFLCDGTHCTNPHHDCINCPCGYSTGGTLTTPNSM